MIQVIKMRSNENNTIIPIGTVAWVVEPSGVAKAWCIEGGDYDGMPARFDLWEQVMIFPPELFEL